MSLVFALIFLLSIYSLGTLASSHQPRASRPPDPSFTWSTIPPSESLVYHDCYSGLQCARLLIPLSHLNTSNPHRIAVAIARLPATTLASDRSHGGTVVLNPGGPGGSGVRFLRLAGREIQARLDGGGPKHYEILSFDPRGVGESEPNTWCFEDDLQAQIWDATIDAFGAVEQSKEALRMHWASEVAWSRLCAHPTRAGFRDDNVRRYISTAETARDMLRIVEEIDKLRAKSLGPQRDSQVTLSDTDLASEAKLQYIGGSYGTVLGNVFASLFPDRVGRMVLDGVVNAVEWVGGFENSTLTDTEQVLQYFYQRCFAGGSACALWRSTDNSTFDVEQRVIALLKRVKEMPIPVVAEGFASLVTYDDLRSGIFISLYQPSAFFTKLAESLNSLLEIKTASFEPDLFWKESLRQPQCGEDGTEPSPVFESVHLADLSAAIQCADKASPPPHSISAFETHLAAATKQNALFGPLLALHNLACYTWSASILPPSSPRLVFNETTANPILFTSSRLDPVTPLANARAMARLRNGSILLEQDSVGHGALFPMGKCLWDHIKRYFDYGSLQDQDIYCDRHIEPFGDLQRMRADAIQVREIAWSRLV